MPKKSTKLPKEDSSSSDNTWEESNKNTRKKQQRKEEINKRKEEASIRKAEAKKILQEEMKSLDKTKPEKITRAQISLESKTKKKEVIEENVNRLIGEEVAARSVDDAISVLQKKKEDKHPEKRRKAAFSAFENRRIQELKKENRELKLSQMKEIVFKEWQKREENSRK